jgi:hypothetical protein
MEMNLLEDISDSEEILESLQVGYMGMQMEHVPLDFEPDDWRKLYPIWQHPVLSARQLIGDCHKMMMEYQLTVMQPYPGDENSIVNPCHPTDRFTVLRLDDRGDTFKI